MPEINIKMLSCAECHVLFWITDLHYNSLEKSKEDFYCPNGHSLTFKGDKKCRK